MIGPGKGDLKPTRVLNRVVHWTPKEYQRPAEIIVKELGLTKDSKSVEIPGIAIKRAEIETEEEVDKTLRTWYR